MSFHRVYSHDDTFSDASYFLAGFHADLRTFSFVKTSPDIIDQSAFLDGRTPVSTDGGIIPVPMDEALSWVRAQSEDTSPNCLIAHVSFCGSTLVSRAISLSGKSISYREPQVLIDLANLHASGHELCAEVNTWRDIIRFTMSQFRKTWGERLAITKPSNWVNTLLQDIISAEVNTRFVTVTIDLEEYLLANIRGGKSRLDYSLNLLNHMTAPVSKYGTLVQNLNASALTPMERLLRFLVILYHQQMELLAGLSAQAQAGSVQHVIKKSLLSDPASELTAICSHFGIPAEAQEIQSSIQSNFSTHSKDTSIPFNPQRETEANNRFRAEFSDAISDALYWYEMDFEQVTLSAVGGT